MLKRYKSIFFVVLILSACTDQPARKPINRNALKEQIQQEKADLLKFSKHQISFEESLIEKAILDRKEKYIRSQHGFWYAYIKKSRKLNLSTPEYGDNALLNYQIKDLSGQVLYSFKPYPGEHYIFDKTFIFNGFQSALKLMKEGEEISFIFPSYLAFGLLGDGYKVKGNTPIECLVRLNILTKTKNKS